MWKWLKKQFAYLQSGGRGDIYQPSEMLIYRYWNGSRMILADPLVLYRKVMDKSGEIYTDTALAQSAHSEAHKGHEGLVNNIREIFEIAPLTDKGGLSEIATLDLLNHFMTYCENIKKNSNQYATPSTSSVDSSNTSEASRPTSNSSASGSTAENPCSVEQDPSISEPALR